MSASRRNENGPDAKPYDGSGRRGWGVEVRVLGPIEVFDGSRSVDVGSRMQRAVLSLMVMDIDRVVSLDRLIDCLWGDEPPATATSALHVYVSGLRKILEPDRAPRAPSRVLITEPPGYALRLPPERLDVVRFEALAREGEALLAAGRPASACHVLETGLALWRGSAYQDLAFESFLQPEITRLNHLRASAREARAEALLAAGRDDEAVVDVSAMVDEDPLRERRWGLLALALYRTGRQGEALRTLDQARRTLGEELGVELGTDLRRLEQDILNQSPALEWQEPVVRAITRPRRVPLRYANDALAAFASALGAQGPDPTEGAVLPPDARPHGYSLTAMGAAAAPFTTKHNNLDLYPETPFQVLYVDDIDIETVGSGTLFTGTNSFIVAEGTPMYVVIGTVNDEPPIVPGFPATPAEAGPYIFGRERWGAEFTLDMDGTITTIGPEYVTGPVPVQGYEPLRVITLAVFIGPLSPGTHTVAIRGQLSGRGVLETFGVSSFQNAFTYTIDVVVED